jgi:hypothetical protein
VEPGGSRALTEILAETPIERAVAETRDRIAWRDVARSMAVEVWTGHWDGYVPNRNNYYLHFDGDGRMRLLPWGVDQTFSARLGPFEGIGLLFWACASDAGCREDYVRALLDVDRVADDLALGDDLTAQVERLRPWYEADPRREHGEGSQDATLDETLSFLDTRGDDLASATSCWLADDVDPDDDGYACDLDCDPAAGDVHPGATDTCGDGLDQDCSGYPDDGLDCPDCVEREVDGGTYWFCTTPRTFAEAEAECEEQGGQLVTLDDDAENEAVWSTAASIREIEWWIGVDDRVEEGLYVDPTGAPLEYGAWAAGEPNDSGGVEDCGHYWSFAPIWNDIDCEATMGTICESSTNRPD